MPFDLSTAIPVREREDGLLEKDTFNLSTARFIETEISMPKKPLGYSPPADKDKAVVELVYKEAGKKVPFGLEVEWALTSKPAKLVTANVLGAIATGGVVPFYNIAKGVVNAESPNSDIGRMVFDSAYKGLAENQNVENLGGAAAKAYPDLPWQITGSMGALAEVLMFMPGIVKGGAELLSKDKQFVLALNKTRQSPKWGDLVTKVSEKSGQPVEVVDQALYNKLYKIRKEADYFKVLNTNLKKATGIDLFSEAGAISVKRAKIGQTVNFKDPQGLIKTGKITELLGERATISLEGREVVATLSQLSLPKTKKVNAKDFGSISPTSSGDFVAYDTVRQERLYIKGKGATIQYFKTEEDARQALDKLYKEKYAETPQKPVLPVPEAQGGTIKPEPPTEGKVILADIKLPSTTMMNEKTIDAMTKAYKEGNSAIFGRPIAVRKTESGYEIIEGEHRAVAAKKAGIEPPIVVLTDAQVEGLNASEVDALAKKEYAKLSPTEGKVGLINIAKQNIDVKGNFTMAGDILTKELSTRTNQEIIDLMKWSREQSPHTQRNIEQTASAELRARGVTVDEIKWQQKKLSTPTGEGQKPPVEPPKTLETAKELPPPPPIETPPQMPTPPETPIPPSELPPEGSMPQPEDPVKKVIQALKEAKPLRAEQEAIYKAERGRRIAKAKAMGAKIGGEQGFYAQLGSLKGAMQKVDFESLKGKISQPDIDALFDKVRQSELSDWEKITTQAGLGKLFGEFGGTVPTEGELKLLKDVFGEEFTDTLLKHQSLLQKFMNISSELLNVPRAVMASFDLSAPLRQGAFMVGRKQWLPAFGEMFKFFGSEKALTESINNIRSRPTYDLMLEHGLALTELDAGLSLKEEKFMTNLAEKIPGIGKIIRASSRAYVGFLNKLRADVFDDLYAKAQELGIPITDKFMDDLVEFVNAGTGRGKLPGQLGKAAVALNSVFFSPRLMVSRISLLNPVFYTSKEPFIRKEALKSLFTFAGAALTLLGLGALAGAEVGTDWRSSDFAKIKIGNMRVDIMAGFQQYLRMAGQLITGEYVSSVTGRVVTLGEGYKPLTRFDIILRQLENKEAPVASFITALLRQQTFMGEDVNVIKEVGERFTPMVLSDLVEIATKNPALLPLGVLGLFGVGIQNYESKSKKSSSVRSSSVKQRRSSSTK